jgi:hypothetical protein
VGNRTDPEVLSTILQHFWHERHTVNATISIQRGQDFVLGSNLDNIARPKT